MGIVGLVLFASLQWQLLTVYEYNPVSPMELEAAIELLHPIDIHKIV